MTSHADLEMTYQHKWDQTFICTVHVVVNVKCKKKILFFFIDTGVDLFYKKHVLHINFI